MRILLVFLLITICAADADAAQRKQGSQRMVTGFMAVTADGRVLAAENERLRFNPASVVKIATSLAAIDRFGYNYRFTSKFYIDGEVTAEGTLHGNLYVVGNGNPGLFEEHIYELAERLYHLGIRHIAGDLVAISDLYYNFELSTSQSLKQIKSVLEGHRRGWERYLEQSGRQPYSQPVITIAGTSRAQTLPPATHIYTAKSLSLKELLKIQNDYSSNFLAEVLGRLVGGAKVIEHHAEQNLGILPNELDFTTASGLGQNTCTPRAAIQLIRGFYTRVLADGHRIEELLPVAGVDAGTLAERFREPELRGMVIGKTGTLTSSGVSALVGVAYTREGEVFFAVMNRGPVWKARLHQDQKIKELIKTMGGSQIAQVSR